VREDALKPLDAVRTRNEIVPGDLGMIVHLHGTIYASQYGFDPTFEAYVAGPIADFILAQSDRERLWIAECHGQLVGCVAIVAAGRDAQLRWFLVHPEARGKGLGRHLLKQALDFCRACGYPSVFLWTVSVLTSAAKLYGAVGFHKVEENPGRRWGMEVIEEKYVLSLE
jgi:N-acetylglutamate synthase-like GNAT family acetyltransferase